MEFTSPDVVPVLSINAYLGVVTRLLLAFGISFQLPVLVYFLARIGLVDHKDMIRFFKYAVLGIFVVASFLTPPDVISQILMAIPLLFLYGVGMIVARIFTTKVREDR